MNSLRVLTILLASMLLPACALDPFRSPKPPLAFADSRFACAVDAELASGLNLNPCEDREFTDPRSIQHRHYQAWNKRECAPDASQQKDGNTPLCKVNEKNRERLQGDYHLSFVEFDDQGWFADRRQMETLFDLLKSLEEKNDGQTLIYVYAHGWKHNASGCDNNVVCFSRSLERTDLVEKVKERNRNVVGVYIGWRGLPFDGFLNNLSFWSRKDTAARVGRGGVFELLVRLKDYRDSRLKDFCISHLAKFRQSEAKAKKTFQGQRDNLVRGSPDCANYLDSNEKPRKLDPGNTPTQLVITGHSFGGLVIYEALSHALMERAANTTSVNGATRYQRAESFGDFVMLVNPAFEGSLYEPLFHIATNRCYEPEQRPVMMIVTSEADSATRIAFPVGRTLSTLLQHKKSSEQADSIRQTIGHNPRYQTHRLESDGGEQEDVGDPSPCPCKYLKPTSNLSVESDLMPQFETFMSNAGDSYAVSHMGKSLLNTRPYGKEVVLLPVPERQCYVETDKAFQKCMGSVKPDEDGEPSILETIQCKGKASERFQKCMADGGSKPKYAASYPYLVISTDAGVIADHNAIYNERFLDFAMTFIDQHISQPNPWAWPQEALAQSCTPTQGALVPSGQSCWLGDGRSCSAPTQ